MGINNSYDLELAKYIWSILKTRITIFMSWGVNPGSMKVIEGGLEFHVQGFKHTGKVRVVLNLGTDLFDVSLIPDAGGKEETVEDIFLDRLVSVIDEHVEKTEDYEKRISEEYRIVRYPLT